FNPENVKKTDAYFERHGGKTIILARFLPIFRAFVPVAAGVGKMHYRQFVFFNMIGALAWGVGLTLLGYFLGQIDFVEKYAEYIILGIVFVSGIPILIELSKGFRSWRQHRKERRSAQETTQESAQEESA
ncbi:MAG: VTT domain-containing protein, partial [Microbacteriaceae bacterium]